MKEGNKYKDITQSYLKGESVISIAKRYNLSREGVYIYLRKMSDWKQIQAKRLAPKQKNA